MTVIEHSRRSAANSAGWAKGGSAGCYSPAVDA